MGATWVGLLVGFGGDAGFALGGIGFAGVAAAEVGEAADPTGVLGKRSVPKPAPKTE
jgi:hypothetical protein